MARTQTGPRISRAKIGKPLHVPLSTLGRLNFMKKMNCVVRLGMPEVYVVGGELTWQEERCDVGDARCSVEQRETERARDVSFFFFSSFARC